MDPRGASNEKGAVCRMSESVFRKAHSAQALFYFGGKKKTLCSVRNVCVCVCACARAGGSNNIYKIWCARSSTCACSRARTAI